MKARLTFFDVHHDLLQVKFDKIVLWIDFEAS